MSSRESVACNCCKQEISTGQGRYVFVNGCVCTECHSAGIDIHELTEEAVSIDEEEEHILMMR